MKFLQIHSFYDNYLQDFYSLRPELVHQPWKQQVDTILDDGFSAAHLHARTLKNEGYTTNTIIANAYSSQIRWGLEHGLAMNEQTTEQDIVRAQIEYFRPEILYISHPIGYDSAFIASLSYRPQVVVGWRASVIPEGTDFRLFDAILSSSDACRKMALNHGAPRAIAFQPGFPEWMLEQHSGITKDVDVLFSGGFHETLHSRRINALLEVAKAPLGWKGEFSIHYHIGYCHRESVPAGVLMYDRGALWASEMHKALASAQIVLNITGDITDGADGNMRMFEVTGAGSLLLMDHHDTLTRYFTPGEEIETFRSHEEMIEKIYFYLNNRERAETIAKKGQEKCLKLHGMRTRAREFKLIMEELLETQVLHHSA
ncbi:glycosyltransferase family 1 protein [bacterium]|nr:glycosyltransferase family 1 protein [bacterium]